MHDRPFTAFYRVPEQEHETFREAVEALAPIYREHAYFWEVQYAASEPTLWIESATFATTDQAERATAARAASEVGRQVDSYRTRLDGYFVRRMIDVLSHGSRSSWPPPLPSLDELSPETRRIWRLAVELSKRLDPHVPAGVDVSPAAMFHQLDLALHRDDPFPDAVAWRLESLLDSLQDDATETTFEPWPAKRPGGAFYSPYAQLREGLLEFGFGGGGIEPVLAFEPISLAELEEPEA